jgi:hypothetical protein
MGGSLKYDALGLYRHRLATALALIDVIYERPLVLCIIGASEKIFFLFEEEENPLK